MRATLVLLACVFAVAVALPAVEVTKNAAPNVPGLQGILLQAENGVEAVRKSRQLGLGGGLLGGGLLGGGSLITLFDNVHALLNVGFTCLIRWIWWKSGLWRRIQPGIWWIQPGLWWIQPRLWRI